MLPYGREGSEFKNHTKVNPNKMMFVGDPHGRYKHIVEAIQLDAPKACVLLGDQCFEEPVDQLFASIQNNTSFHWIHGNHDTDRQSWYANLFESDWQDRNIHGQVKPLSGIDVAGLGGVFRGQIWMPGESMNYMDRASWKQKHYSNKYRQIERKHQSTIWPEDYNKLGNYNADILVLHEAPSCHKHGFSELDDLAGVLGVKLIVHGHHHREYQDILGNGVAVVGLGLAQIAMLDMDAFKESKNPEEVIAAFDFGKVANRDGGWLH